MFTIPEIILMNDQPTTCGYCGARCEDIGDFMHTNSKRYVVQCLNEDCKVVYYTVEDEYSLKVWKVI